MNNSTNTNVLGKHAKITWADVVKKKEWRVQQQEIK